MLAAPDTGQSGQTPIITLAGVTKRFPGVVANDSIDLDIYPGEVHVLLGENGAGKSTLIGLLSGLQVPDSGQISVDGNPVTIRSPAQALALGIGTVFQHAMLVPTLTVAQNLMLGAPWWQRPARSELEVRAGEVFSSLGISINLDAIAADLSLGQQQQVEIVRALLRNSQVLILDESTSMLPPSGVEELGALMRRLVKRGLAVIFITHKLNEAAAYGDRISVLKLGRKVGEVTPERFKALGQDGLVRHIVELMFGDNDSDVETLSPVALRKIETRKTVLSVSELCTQSTPTAPGCTNISFDLAPGEILGIAGIDGNGQKQLAEALAGQLPLSGGHVCLDGKAINSLSVGARRDAGLRYLTDDRLGEGTVGSFALSVNFLLKEVGLAPYWTGGFRQQERIDSLARQLIAEYDIRTPGPDTPIGRLSGGNIQKALLARELGNEAKVVVFNKPTYGLDVSNTLATRRRIAQIAADGMAVVLISNELDELLGLCARIAVMSQGRITGMVKNDETARRSVGRLMVGVAA